MHNIAIYPGTFDPATNGHLDIIERAVPLFAQVIVAVTCDSSKPTLFSIQDRIQMIKDVTQNYSNVRVEEFSGLLVDYACKKEANVIIRGLRAVSDFEHEFQMASLNKRLNPKIETLFMMTHEDNFFLSSSAIKEIAALGGSLAGFVPNIIEERIKQRLSN
ncbi:MAG: pantetheine-phosphate adenylyltransferase [bacterium]|nr:pantetheine-phosphate adenylyltransferase [bacterium]